ncbi:MAG: hypothetical protein ACRD8O_01500 [Bryobacteraceae bacterium]
MSKSLILLTSIAVALAADKDSGRFTHGPASSYPSRQTNDKVTIAAVPYYGDDQVKSAFGKVNPNQHGILPVLIVIQNDGTESMRLEGVRVEYIGPDRSKIEATPAKDLPYLSGPRQPKPVSGPLPTGMPRVSRKKNPLADAVFEIRAFSAKMLAPGQQASGFFYFQTGHRRLAHLYVTGLREAASGKELFYFEIPFDR